jgi:hypothetical protein
MMSNPWTWNLPDCMPPPTDLKATRSVVVVIAASAPGHDKDAPFTAAILLDGKLAFTHELEKGELAKVHAGASQLAHDSGVPLVVYDGSNKSGSPVPCPPWKNSTPPSLSGFTKVVDELGELAKLFSK